MDNLISVIIPVYNIKEYLPRCVESVCAQTYKNLEILLVDDGSTDGTGELCDELAKKDARIRVYHKENGGSSSARNLGIENAKGQYLGFVDSDDYISADMYEQLYLALQTNGVPIAQIGRDEIDAEGNILANICEPPAVETCIKSEDFMRELLMHRGDCSFCTKLVKKELFKKDKFPLGVLNEDFHLLIRMLPQISGIVSLPGQAYHVFYRIGSNTRKENKNDFSRVYGDCVENADMAAALVEKHYPDLKAVAVRFGAFQRLEYLLHIPIGQMQKSNTMYKGIVKNIRKNLFRFMGNKYLTGKNKIYLLLFAIAPKSLRKFHKKIKGL